MPNQNPAPSDSSEDATNHDGINTYHEGATLADARPDARAGAHRTDGGRRGDDKDAPPSNTASSNCNRGYFQPLRWGIDSLYLSYPGKLFPAIAEELQKLKAIAQSPEPYQRVTAQLELDGHIFEVKDKGAPLFPFILEDNAFRLQVSRSSGKVPLAYVKVSSEYLSHVLPKEAEESLRRVVALLGEITEAANVSRIDLFVDFASSENMESWDRTAWVTRARSINAYSVDNQFSGWSVGIGGIISARLYDKTLEIEKSHKTYLHDLWKASGWDGVSPVWRLEFELKREVLTDLRLSKLVDVLGNLNGLWSYATTDWLRLTIPNSDDQTRSRWPIHPLWGHLSSVDWETPGGPLSKRFDNARLPSRDKMFSLAFSMIINFMARRKIHDLYDGLREFEAEMYAYHERKSYNLGLSFDKYVEERLSIKRKEFNTMLNPKPKPKPEKDPQEALDRAAEAYRKASKG